jgi:L-iditol 2-dehydrogenase
MAVRHTGSNLRRSRDLDSLDEPFDLVVVQWNIILVEPAHTRRPEVLFTIEEDTPVERLAHAEPLACCVGGQKQTPVGRDDTVLIVGAGPIGLFQLQLALLSGAKTVIVSQPSAPRREFAADLGARLTVDPNDDDDLFSVVAEATGDAART